MYSILKLVYVSELLRKGDQQALALVIDESVDYIRFQDYTLKHITDVIEASNVTLQQALDALAKSAARIENMKFRFMEN